MIQYHSNRIVSALAVASVFIAAQSASAAVITDGTEIGVDFGPTAPTNNFNQAAATAAFGSIAAGSVDDTSGVVVDGVGFTYSGAGVGGGPFSNNDAVTVGGEPAALDESNRTDWLGMSGGTGPNVFTLTFTGLDDSLTYDLSVGAGFTNDLPDTFWQADGQSATTDADVNGSAYVSFTGLETDGAGNLVITGTGTSPRPDIPAVAALVLTANAAVIPTPAALPAGLALLGLAATRRRRMK